MVHCLSRYVNTHISMHGYERGVVGLDRPHQKAWLQLSTICRAKHAISVAATALPFPYIEISSPIPQLSDQCSVLSAGIVKKSSNVQPLT